MKTTRRLTLGEALDEIASVSEEIRTRGTAIVDGHVFPLESPVTLEIEAEAGGKKAELEFEIKFAPAEAREEDEQRSRGRAPLLVLGLGAAAVAAVLVAFNRRRSGQSRA